MDDNSISNNAEWFGDTDPQSSVDALRTDSSARVSSADDLDEGISNEDSILRRAATELAERKAELRALAILKLAPAGTNDVDSIAEWLDDPSSTVRSAAVKALYETHPEGAASLLNNVARQGSTEQRQRLGKAIVDAGLVDVPVLQNEDSRTFYPALALLFLLAKLGEIEPLLDVIRNHSDINVRLALIKTIATSKSPQVNPAFQQLLIDPSLPREVRSAVMEVVVELSQEN
jgi:HEAT repeat protein